MSIIKWIKEQSTTDKIDKIWVWLKHYNGTDYKDYKIPKNN